MDKPWLASYPDQIPAEINDERYTSLAAMFDQAVASARQPIAFTNFGRDLSYQELDRLSRAFAGYLRTTLGLEKGDRVAIMMPNLLQYPVALFGVLRAGLVVVNTNPLYTDRELEHQLADAGVTTIVIVENFAHVLAECIERTPVRNVIITRMGDLLGFPRSVLVNFVVKYVKKLVPAFSLPGATQFPRALEIGASAEFSPPEIDLTDLAFLQYTGGTTGIAKGAMLTHGNMVANVEQARAWLLPFVEDGGEVVVTALPLYHIFALTANCLTFMTLGARNYLITNPRDMPAFVKEVSQIGFTVITGVNTLFNGLLNTPGFDRVDFSRLKIALGGGMAVQKSVAQRWQQVTGRSLLEAYGLTETSPAVCINPLTLEAYNGSIGLPVPSTEVCVRDEQGHTLGLNQPGELFVRGPQVMKGYWQRPEDTKAVLDADGWLATGDIAEIDEQGFVRIVDRKKDMILVSGFNVYPNEIEDVVAAHPDVLEVGAIGVPDERSGEAVRLVVVKKNPALTEETLFEYCREELTGYKRPRSVVFADELPKSNVGKILRRELREKFGVT